MNERPVRKSVRLKCYDYAQNGAYFVTVCVQDRRNILWTLEREAGDRKGRPYKLLGEDPGAVGAGLAPARIAGTTGFAVDRKDCACGLTEEEPGDLGRLPLSCLGLIAESAFEKVERLYGVEFDSRTVMPNHVHFIVFLPGQQQLTLGRVVGAYKSLVVNEWRKYCCACGLQMGKIWQRNYYEHVIRCETELYEVRKYIEENPLKWREDELYMA